MLPAAVLILICSEILLRIIDPRALQYYRRLKLLHTYNDQYFVSLAANQDQYLRQAAGLWEGRFTTNSMGYRGSPEPDPSMPKIVCLGDSMVMGFGVSDQDTFCYGINNVVLSGRKHQSMNLGVDAFGSLGSARRLADSAEKLKNIHVALFIISPNDFTIPDELRSRGVLPDDDTDEIRDADPSYRMSFRIQFELTRYSYTLMSLKLSYEQLRIKWEENKRQIRSELVQSGLSAKDESNPYEQPLCVRGPWNYFINSFYHIPADPPCPGDAERIPDCSGAGGPADGHGQVLPLIAVCPQPVPAGVQCLPRPPAVLPPLPASTQKAYRLMMETAKKRGIFLTAVMMPIDNNVLYCGTHGLHSAQFEYALRAGEYFKKLGIPVIDLRPYVPRMCGEKLPSLTDRLSGVDDYYIRADGHYTAAGNRWARDALLLELKKMEKQGAF